MIVEGFCAGNEDGQRKKEKNGFGIKLPTKVDMPLNKNKTNLFFKWNGNTCLKLNDCV